MALKGTLRDFGIADILQLISQQTKTGVLHLQAKDEEVHVSFHEGVVVRAEHRSRDRKDLLGRMLLRAGLITEPALEKALEEQKRTLRRLGDILIENGAIPPGDLKEMAQLQATETLYKLFGWKNGTYAFEQGMVEWDKDSITPIRAESVLMEGFRMIDEWPLVRKAISSSQMTFDRLKSLEAEMTSRDEEDDSLDLLGESQGPRESTGAKSVGKNERHVMSFVWPGRTVEQLIDLSRLGEFETYKALYNLVGTGYLRALPPRREESGSGAGTVAERLLGFGVRLLMSAAILALVLVMLWYGRNADAARAQTLEGARITDPAAQRVVAGPQLARIRAALEVFRLEHGNLPESLRDVVTAGLLGESDLRWPWTEVYYYRRAGELPEGYVLLSPLR